MAMGRVRAGFFHTRTQPAGQDPWPKPSLFRVPGFFPGPGPAPAGPRRSHGPRLGIGPNSWPNQKKKNLSPDLFLPFKPLHIPNKKIKPKFIFAYIQAYIFKFKPK